MSKETKTSKTQSLGFFEILKMLWQARKLRPHEKWSRKEIVQYRQKKLQKPRSFAYASSPFYKKFHQGLEDKPFNELPVLTQKELMASWDEIVTDRNLQLKDVQQFLNNVKGF